MDVTLAYPSEHFALEPTVIKWCKDNADESGGKFEISNDLQDAYNSAHVVFPRNWMTAEAFVNEYSHLYICNSHKCANKRSTYGEQNKLLGKKSRKSS